MSLGCKIQHHVPNITKQGYLTNAVLEFCSDIKDFKSDSQEMKTTKKCCYDKFEKLRNMRNLKIMSVKKFNTFGGGRKSSWSMGKFIQMVHWCKNQPKSTATKAIILFTN